MCLWTKSRFISKTKEVVLVDVYRRHPPKPPKIWINEKQYTCIHFSQCFNTHHQNIKIYDIFRLHLYSLSKEASEKQHIQGKIKLNSQLCRLRLSRVLLFSQVYIVYHEVSIVYSRSLSVESSVTSSNLFGIWSQSFSSKVVLVDGI